MSSKKASPILPYLINEGQKQNQISQYYNKDVLKEKSDKSYEDGTNPDKKKPTKTTIPVTKNIKMI